MNASNRNKRCHCGSGKKSKHCCGNPVLLLNLVKAKAAELTKKHEDEVARRQAETSAVHVCDACKVEVDGDHSHAVAKLIEGGAGGRVNVRLCSGCYGLKVKGQDAPKNAETGNVGASPAIPQARSRGVRSFPLVAAAALIGMAGLPSRVR